ncbi:MAG: hypothetical protein U0Q11_27150 [Vicinamibacterales bacterium]
MSTEQIRFNDGAAYERYMGVWSQKVGTAFLDWLAPEPGLRWLDIGCGNGAFTEMLLDRCAPSGVDGIDPSEAQPTQRHGWPHAVHDFSAATRCICRSMTILFGAAAAAAGDLLRSGARAWRRRDDPRRARRRHRLGLCVMPWRGPASTR